MPDKAVATPSPVAAEFTKAWEDAVNVVINGKKDATTALAGAQKEAQAALDPSDRGGGSPCRCPSWTDLMKPLIYLQDTRLVTLPRGLKAVLDQFGQGGELKWEMVLSPPASSPPCR